jgi:hypothetical protein
VNVVVTSNFQRIKHEATIWMYRIALLSEEGSVIASRSREGWFQSRTHQGWSLRATPPDSEGECLFLNTVDALVEHFHGVFRIARLRNSLYSFPFERSL